jgi:hypothetical protein
MRNVRPSVVTRSEGAAVAERSRMNQLSITGKRSIRRNPPLGESRIPYRFATNPSWFMRVWRDGVARVRRRRVSLRGLRNSE